MRNPAVLGVLVLMLVVAGCNPFLDRLIRGECPTLSDEINATGWIDEARAALRSLGA
jgi:hypothetical protein